MDEIVKNLLSSLELGEEQHYQNMHLFPLFYSGNHSPEYLTLKEALEKNLLVITEVQQQGSVPELRVKNQSPFTILLLDGEELMGAKQNRILNTSILINEMSEIIIPVSCTEQGRWSYSSPQFMDSDLVAASRIRASKAKTVSASLKESKRFLSDQLKVWHTVKELAFESKVYSPTSAMRDIYTARENDISDYLKQFTHLEGQKGVLVFINGKVTGMDYLSFEPAFKNLYPKLMKSYVIDAMLMKKNGEKNDLRKMAENFLNQAKECSEKKYKSVGKGWDHRYEGKELVGSALVSDEKVIHLAFFRIDEDEKAGNMSSSSQRRQFRIL